MAYNISNEVFKERVVKYSKLIFSVCYRLTGDYHEAENITQETFLAAFKADSRFEGDNYKAWLVKIASNKCKDYLKSAHVKRSKLVDIEELWQIKATDNTLENTLRAEEVDSIKSACSNLEEPYKSVAQLHFLEDKSFDEVAKVLNRPVKTVQTQVYRARDKLKLLLKEVVVCE